MRFNLKKCFSVILSTGFFIAGFQPDANALGGGALGNQTTISAKSIGHGAAFAGVADDPSAIFFNPGGLTQSKGFQLMGGAGVLSINSEHSTPAGTKDSMAKNLPIVPYFYASYSKDQSPWAFGLGVNSPFGLITEWKDESFSQYWATKTKLLMYIVNPTVAYAFSDKFSAGFGVDFFNVFDTELNQRIPNATFTAPGGHAKITGDGTAWGYNLGFHWKPIDKHSFGLSYRSQVNVPIEGDVEVKDNSHPLIFGGAATYNSAVTTEFKFPQSVLFGYGFRPNQKWTVFGDYEWVNNSATESTDFNYAQYNASLLQSIRRDWRSTNNIGAGAEVKLNERVDFRFGGLIYERVIPSGTLEASLPDSSRFLLSLGTGIHFKDTTFDIGYSAIFFNKRTVDNSAGNPALLPFGLTSQDGTFKTMINIFSVGVSQKFGRS